MPPAPKNNCDMKTPLSLPAAIMILAAAICFEACSAADTVDTAATAAPVAPSAGEGRSDRTPAQEEPEPVAADDAVSQSPYEDTGDIALTRIYPAGGSLWELVPNELAVVRNAGELAALTGDTSLDIDFERSSLLAVYIETPHGIQRIESGLRAAGDGFEYRIGVTLYCTCVIGSELLLVRTDTAIPAGCDVAFSIDM